MRRVSAVSTAAARRAVGITAQCTSVVFSTSRVTSTRWVSSASVGVQDSAASVAAMAKLTEADLAHTRPSIVSWARIYVIRNRVANLAATAKPSDDYIAIRNRIANSTKAEKEAALKSKELASAAASNCKTLLNLIELMEQKMLPIRAFDEKLDALQQEIDLTQDTINLGLSRNTEEVVNAAKERIVKAKEELAQNQESLVKYSRQHFSTALWNDFLTLLTVAGQNDVDSANVYAFKACEDMVLAQVESDDVSRQLHKYIIHGDDAFNDSDLLFSMVENPERGEVSVAPVKDLNSVSDSVLSVIANRHTTPLTEGLYLKQKDTHPCIQRSPE